MNLRKKIKNVGNEYIPLKSQEKQMVKESE